MHMRCMNKASRREENPAAFKKSAQQLHRESTLHCYKHVPSPTLKASFKIKGNYQLFCYGYNVMRSVCSLLG